MEFAQQWMSSSLFHACAAGMSATLIYPLIFVPISNMWIRHKRSINRHSSKHGEKPKGYWFVVVRALVIVGLLTSLFLWWAATCPRVSWAWNEASISNTVLSGVSVFYLREFLNYWVHRLFHANRFLYNTFHAGHHEIEHVSDPYDGIYGYVGDSICGMLVIYGSFVMLPMPIHIFAVITYLLVVGLFGFMLNHCGRQVVVRIGPLELYNNQHHDVHHTHRHGNFSDFCPLLDQWFGTEIVSKKSQRRPLPAVERWNLVRDNLVWLREGVRSQGMGTTLSSLSG